MNKQDPRYEKLQTLLRDLRKKQGVRQQELAEKLGRPQSYVSKYEVGDRNIDFIELIDLINRLDLDVAKSLVSLCQSLESE